MSNPKVRFTMADGGVMVAELYPDIAPKTAANFLKLVGQGYYNGLSFHRVIPGFMIQGGCPRGDGTGGPDERLFGEFRQNGFNNTLRHKRGVLSMARASDPNSAGSQFFIMVDDAPHLDGGYAAFGKITEGLEVADAIALVERDYRDKPRKPVVMTTVEIIEE